jgi:hypothetical protein
MQLQLHWHQETKPLRVVSRKKSLATAYPENPSVSRLVTTGSESATFGDMLTPGRNWKVSYETAVSEQDKRKLASLVARAESDIVSRLQELPINPENQEERTSLHAALRILLGLQIRKLGQARTWPTERVSR